MIPFQSGWSSRKMDIELDLMTQSDPIWRENTMTAIK